MKRVELEKWLESNLTIDNLLCLYNYFYQKCYSRPYKNIEDFLDNAFKPSHRYAISPLYSISRYSEVRDKILSSEKGSTLEETKSTDTPVGLELELDLNDDINLVFVDTETLCEYISNYVMNILQTNGGTLSNDPIECISMAMNLVK